MKRPRKRLRWAIAAISTSLLVLTVVAWVWSEFQAVTISPTPTDNVRYGVTVWKGAFILSRESDHLGWSQQEWNQESLVTSRVPGLDRRERLFFPDWRTESLDNTYHGPLLTARELILPLWIPLLLLGFVSWRYRRWLVRSSPNQCESCTYDLRGLPSSAANCPECGTKLAVRTNGPEA